MAPQQTECKIKKSLATSTALRTILSLSFSQQQHHCLLHRSSPLHHPLSSPRRTVCLRFCHQQRQLFLIIRRRAVVVCKLLMKSAQSPNVVSSGATSHLPHATPLCRYPLPSSFPCHFMLPSTLRPHVAQRRQREISLFLIEMFAIVLRMPPRP